MDAEDEVDVKTVGLIVTAFFRKEKRPVRAAAIGIVYGDLLQRSLGESGDRKDQGKGRLEMVLRFMQVPPA